MNQSQKVSDFSSFLKIKNRKYLPNAIFLFNQSTISFYYRNWGNLAKGDHDKKLLSSIIKIFFWSPTFSGYFTKLVSEEGRKFGSDFRVAFFVGGFFEILLPAEKCH